MDALGIDLTSWSRWWDYNKAPYLDLKARIHEPQPETGSDGGLTEERVRTLRPTEGQVRDQVVPALLDVLASSSNNDLVTGTLVALAKIGADGRAEEAERIESAIAAFLVDANQEIRETAAVSLGILAHPRSIPILANLLWDTEQGRKRVKGSEVDPRTRAFAAYGLGLIGARATSESVRRVVVSALRVALERDETRSHDLSVACLIAFSIVPLSMPATELRAPGERRAPEPPESSREAQIDYVLAVLGDREQPAVVRAQCPIALARLLADLPPAVHEILRARVAGELLDLVERDHDPELTQSCILALGEIGTSDEKSAVDRRIRSTLQQTVKAVSENQSRGFVLIALARIGGRPGAGASTGGLSDSADFLVEQLQNGKSALRPWAGLACGVLGHELRRLGTAAPTLEELRRAVRTTLEDERDPASVGAYAIGAGLLGDLESAPRLVKLLEQSLQDDARGRVAIGLALMGHREARGTARAIVLESTYRPVLLRDCAIGLGLMGDKEAVPMLSRLLEDSRSLAAQASIATALGFVGDQRALDPLLATLKSSSLTEHARAFAAVALGNVADKETLPWNSKLALWLNYRAATPTLTDPGTGTGILDIL